MNPEDILERHREDGLRPQLIQRIRGDIIEHTGLTPPRGLAETEEWYSRMKGEITKRLTDDEEGGDS